ncbi:MAG: DUF4331 family protein [Deltaproteobacteria bacterium]|nr:DUF4331 family protein [Deltaproteobacteria bacterium]
MKNLTKILVSFSATAALVSCGDDHAAPDAPRPIDAAVDAPPDALVIPAVPTLGAPIDRMGRPAVNTALVAPFDNDPLKTAKKDAYNRAVDQTMWLTTVVDPATSPPKTIRGEFAPNMGAFDSLDQGSGLPNTMAGPGGGCGNAALYSMTTGYATLATVLVDDQLYVDTAKLTCNSYLSLEVEVATGGGVVHSQCGGRTMTHDVVDVSYSLLSAGLNGFNQTLTPLVTDGVGPHTDILGNDTFPFLGPPH